MSKLVLVPQKGGGGATAAGDKATFGILTDLTVAADLTNHYICRKGGAFVDCVVNLKTPPTGSPAILDIEISTDDAANWASIFPTGPKITLPAASTSTVTVDTFEASPLDRIAAGNLLRVNCLQKGSTTPGNRIEVVLRWQ